MIDLKMFSAPDTYNIADEIDKHFSGKIALKWENEDGIHTEITYAELIKKANKLANGLIKLGMKKGDRILIMTPRLIESYVIYLACLKAGLVIIPASELLRAKDLSYRLRHSEATAVISYYQFCEEFLHIKEDIPSLRYKIALGDKVVDWLRIEEVADSESDEFDRVQTSKDDPAFLPYTSGTTGQPKGVVHSHGWGYAHLRIAADKWLNISKDDVVWATAAPGWQKWVWSPFLSILGTGATGFSYSGKFHPHKYLTLLQNHKINVLCCTPTEYRMMAKMDHLNEFDLSSLHSAVSAGEALNGEVIDVFNRYFNVQIRDGYGQTESTLLIGTLKGMESKIGSMGKPILEDFIEIVDDEGNPVSVGEVGNIGVRKDLPALFDRYYKDKERTNKSFQGDYFLTGDRASKDEDDYYWFQGRSDDVIISSGYTIGPFEVEDALMKHEAVKECAVVASPDSVRGHVVKAFIILKDSAFASDKLVKELQRFVKDLTAPYKYPRLIEFVQSLPKTDSGKIRRVALRGKVN